jgi:hypothetical protein
VLASGPTRASPERQRTPILNNTIMGNIAACI